MPLSYQQQQQDEMRQVAVSWTVKMSARVTYSLTTKCHPSLHARHLSSTHCHAFTLHYLSAVTHFVCAVIFSYSYSSSSFSSSSWGLG